ncbi:MAG: ATP-binding protein [Ardenticatenaceae bacterium]|nr:ATP-binding protein [Anaerolineales bacterium]MCB9009799.1 ATP-binding protein [Ardenticatenaceae bacterium]
MGVKHVLTVPGRYEEIQKICQFVAEGAAQSGLDETAIFHIELACDEACTNIIEHAYEGEDKGSIHISWQLTGSSFTITFHDNGRSFDPKAVPTPTLPPAPATSPDIDQVKVGGLGIHFMRQLMDDVQFYFDEDAGNTLILVKKKA